MGRFTSGSAIRSPSRAWMAPPSPIMVTRGPPSCARAPAKCSDSSTPATGHRRLPARSAPCFPASAPRFCNVDATKGAPYAHRVKRVPIQGPETPGQEEGESQPARERGPAGPEPELDEEVFVRATSDPAVHREVLQGFSGPYSLGVARAPEGAGRIPIGRRAGRKAAAPRRPLNAGGASQGAVRARGLAPPGKRQSKR